MSVKNLQKRHCMIVHAYYPVGETRVQREALALIDAGYGVDVICLRQQDEAPRAEEDGVQIYRLPVRRHKGYGLFVQLLEYLMFLILATLRVSVLHLRQRYGTVQIHNLPDFLIFAGLVPKLTGARLILDLHDLMPEFFASKFDSGMESRAVRLVIWQERLSCWFANHVITVTESWRQTLIERGVPANKVSVVMNVADPRIFKRNGKRPFPPSNGHGFHLIYHGTFAHRYGVDMILRAVEQVRPSIPNIHATLLGGGEFRDELVQLVQELDLAENVKISPTLLPVADLPPLLQQADVGIVPNRSNIFTDGLLPTKLMEYVAVGTPVIAARTPTITTYFDDQMVQFFTPDDVEDLTRCILQLGQDQARLKAMSQNADKFNQQYSWENVAANYVALVDQQNES
ncbi:MAG: glycosyl transferase family 1 [Ardenticatenaceae bacterium]|nr:MAG: glycosyl transferase family 1 [Ardenticatenaceae bacterium]